MISGDKGGSKKPYVPIEQRDNLHSIARVKLLVALGEGEFQSTPSGRDIYLDDTPLQNADGSNNFNGVRYEYRSGTQHQEYIKGIPSVENEFGLNTEVKSSVPFVRAINNTSLSSVRVRIGFPQLVNMKDNGDVVGTSVRYAIELSTDGGSYETVVSETITGKTSGYEISRTVILPDALSGWQIRVRKLTGDSTSSKLVNNMFIKGVTEVIDAKLRYPNTALLYVEFDSSQFQNTPKVSVRVKGRAWPVPSNYNPETRTYLGIWDGTFKQAWTDNPVWIGYGLMTHERFGLGKRIKPENIDKWELYRISQYCDQLVPDGKGGAEPRFTCNMYIQSRADAWVVLRDIAAIYRGMTYWSNSQLSSIADMPRDIDYLFSRSNVIDGTFTYSGDSVRNIYTRALISYDNPDNMYNSDTTTVSDTDLMRRYRDNLLEISAIGCTRQSEAQRRGKWALLTNSKNRLVRFKVGLDGNIPRVGYIIGIADQLLSGKPNGGRVVSVQDKVVKLDRDTEIKVGDKLYLNTSTGESEVRTVSAVADNGRTITVSVKYNESVTVGAQWASESSELYIQQYRVMSITKEDEYINIEAVYHNPDKYASIDTGARLEDRPITVIPPSVQSPPTNVTISSNTMVEQGMSVTTMTIKWDIPEGASYSDVEWRKDDGDWIKISSIGGGEVDVRGVYSGRYLARVRCYNSVGVSSVFAESPMVDIAGKEGLPPEVVNFTANSIIFGIDLSWDFPLGALDTSYTEIVYSQSPDFATAITLGNFAYPIKTHSIMGLSAGARFFFWARLVDKSGNKGEWTLMIDGTSSADASEILDYIVGQITETELADSLRGRIDAIESVSVNIEDVIVDIDNINTEVDNLNNMIEQLETQLTDITGSQEWDVNQPYLTGTLVQHDGSLYRAKQDVPAGTPVTNEAYWDKVGDYASIGEAVVVLSTQVNNMQVLVDEATGAVSAQADTLTSLVARARGERADGEKADALRGYETQAAIAVRQRVEATDKEALAERLTLIDASMGDTSAKLSTLESSFVSEVQSTAQRIDQLTASLTSTNGNLQGVASSVQLLQSEVTSLDGRVTANTEMTTVLNASLTDTNDNLQGVANSLQSLQSEVTSLDGKITSNSEMTTALSASLRGSRADGEKADALDGWIAQTNYVQSVKVQATDNEATVESIEQLQASVGSNTAAIQNEATVRADEVTVLSSQISTVQAKVGDNSAAIQRVTQAQVSDNEATVESIEQLQASVGVNTAAIQNEATARADADSALATQINTVQAEVEGEIQSSVQTIATAVADLDKDTKAMWTTKLQVNSNNQYVFAGIGLGIENVGGTLQSQFLIEANRFALLNTIDGVTTSPFLVEGGQVFMNSAVIKKADIVNAVITGELRSGDYVAGVRGIRMNFVDGSFELNGSVAGQGRMMITNQRIDVRDNTGKLRVRMGLL